MNLQHNFMLFPVIETERLILRELTLEDAEDYYNYYNNPYVTKHLDWDGPTSIESAKEVIHAWKRGYQDKLIIPWGITTNRNNTLIGTISCITLRSTFEKEPLYPTAVGFVLSHEYWNQGIMSEALKAVITFNFEELRSHRVQAEVIPENAASIHILKNLGFKVEGLLRKYSYHEDNNLFKDILLMALLKEEHKRF